MRTEKKMGRNERLENDELKKLKDKLKKEGCQYVDSWNCKVMKHKHKLKRDTDYAMEMMKNERDLLMQRSYQLKD
jgi:hypothetical protein